jgi:hypothetical protein
MSPPPLSDLSHGEVVPPLVPPVPPSPDPDPLSAGALFTSTEIFADDVLPEVSVARAVTVCDPSESFVVSIGNVHVSVPLAGANAPPSTATSTTATATSSVAVPATFTVPFTFVPAEGASIVSVGATVSGAGVGAGVGHVLVLLQLPPCALSLPLPLCAAMARCAGTPSNRRTTISRVQPRRTPCGELVPMQTSVRRQNRSPPSPRASRACLAFAARTRALPGIGYRPEGPEYSV